MQAKRLIPGQILIKEKIRSSSSENIYEIIIYDNCVSCTCPAGGNKMLCKHIRNIVYKNNEILKAKAPVLLENILKILMSKNKAIYNNLDRIKLVMPELLEEIFISLLTKNTEIKKSELHDLLSETFYVDANIAAVSHSY